MPYGQGPQYVHEVMVNAKFNSRFSVLLFVALLWPGAGFPHASEQGFVLLLPTDAYIAAGTAAVAISLLLVGASSGQRIARLFTPVALFRLPALRRLPLWTSLLSTVLFFMLIWIGAYGPNDPQRNLLPLTIWSGWWVGLFVLQGLIGDIWRWLNPWQGLYALVFREAQAPRKLPEAFGIWPAVCLMLAFFGFVIADIAPSDPDRLAQFAMLYWVFTLAGMTLFGAKDWLQRVECFTVLFALIAALAPLRWGKRLQIGFPGWGLLHLPAANLGLAAFCVVLLASGSFDGLHETFWWLAQIGINPLAFPGRSAVAVPSAISLIASNLALCAVFLLAVWGGLFLVRRSGYRENLSLAKAFAGFAITLLPLAYGYHFAHYLTSFLVQIQYLTAAIADPFARGWNLFGLGGRPVTTGFFNDPTKVKVIWLTQAAVVVGSHMVSVMLAHVIASRQFTRRRHIVLVQVGLGILMIFYTIFGLWLLASPRGV